MKIRLILTLAISKLIIKACRVLRWGGTTLAGKVALKIHPGILSVLARDYRVIMVTGTNGKTTTTRIVGRILEDNGVSYITNRSGANLISGIATTFIDAAGLTGTSKAKTALLEVDEATFQRAADHIKPEILIVTNFFRDQLDRYGELYTTLKSVQAGIVKTPETKLVLNADDSLCTSLGRIPGVKAIYYGIRNDAYNSPEQLSNSDAMFCLYCKARYEYSNRVYGHLGSFACPGCGYRKPETNVTCTGIDELNSGYSQIKLEFSGSESSSESISESGSENVYSARVNLPGIYNIYNALAAAACGDALGYSRDLIVKSLGSFECGFGRMETIKADNRTIKVILVKNPTGFNQVLSFLLTEESGFQLAFAINDRIADGTDISWLWDVDFEKLTHVQDKVACFYTSGTRGEDMAVRLKYAGISSDRIMIEKDYNALIDRVLSCMEENQVFYILPTYTAMLDIRKILKNKFKLKEFWK